jgi:hypothetical protein
MADAAQREDYVAHELDEEANDRLAACRVQKQPFEMDMREGYFFTAPLRKRLINSQSQPPTVPFHDDGFLQTNAGFEIVGDFCTEITNTFLPQAEQWCQREKGPGLTKAQWDQIEGQVRDDDKTIFEAIKASNFYAEFAKAAYPDLALGTCAMNIDDPRPTWNAINSQAVPLRELEINLGPDGTIDDRFIIRYTKQRYVKMLLRGCALPIDIERAISGAPNKYTEVRWAYWRLWDEEGDIAWRHVTMVRNRVVHSATFRGEGSCPLIPMRFYATADWAFALGPLLQGLPEFRQVDELEGQKIQHIELNLTPPYAFPDDSFAAIEQGLEPGMGYPVRVGSESAIKPIYTPHPATDAMYAVDDKIRRLRKLFYVDYPEQRGDTPPTLGQWMDELARAQRRIGTPGLVFWQEGVRQIFLRYKYLLEQRGVIRPIRVDGHNVTLAPLNPAQRAAEQQEIATAVRAIQILGQAFPEEFKAYIDGKKTMQEFLKKMRVEMLKFRDEQQVGAAVQQIKQLLSPRIGPTANPQQAAGLP